MANLEDSFKIADQYKISNPAYRQDTDTFTLDTSSINSNLQLVKIQQQLKEQKERGTKYRPYEQRHIGENAVNYAKQELLRDLSSRKPWEVTQEDYQKAISPYTESKTVGHEQAKLNNVLTGLCFANMYADTWGNKTQEDIKAATNLIDWVKNNGNDQWINKQVFDEVTQNEPEDFKKKTLYALAYLQREISEHHKDDTYSVNGEQHTYDDIHPMSFYMDDSENSKFNKTDRYYQQAIYNYDQVAMELPLDPDQIKLYNQISQIGNLEEQLKEKKGFLNKIAYSLHSAQGSNSFKAQRREKNETDAQKVNDWFRDTFVTSKAGQFIGKNIFSTIPAIHQVASILTGNKVNPVEKEKGVMDLSQKAWATLWNGIGSVCSFATDLWYDAFGKGNTDKIRGEENWESKYNWMDVSIEKYAKDYNELKKLQFKESDPVKYDQIIKEGMSQIDNILPQISGYYRNRKDYNVDINQSQKQELFEKYVLDSAILGEESALLNMLTGIQKELYNNYQNSGFWNRMGVSAKRAWRAFLADVIATSVSMATVVSHPEIFIGDTEGLVKDDWLKFASDVMQSSYIDPEDLNKWRNEDQSTRISYSQQLYDPDKMSSWNNGDTMGMIFDLIGQYGFTVGTTLASFGTSTITKELTTTINKGVTSALLRKELFNEVRSQGISRMQAMFGNFARTFSSLDKGVVSAAKFRVGRTMLPWARRLDHYPLIFLGGYLGTAEGALEARSTYDEALESLYKANDELWERLHNEEANIVRDEAKNFYLNNPEIVDQEIRSNPSLYGAYITVETIHGFENSELQLQLNYAASMLRLKALEKLIDEALFTYKSKDERYQRNYDQAEEAALLAGSANFWLNSVINGTLSLTWKSNTLSKHTREALAERKNLLERSIEFIQDSKNASVGIKAALKKQKILPYMAHYTKEHLKESFGEFGEEFAQNLTNVFSQNMVESAYTAYMLQTYDPSNTDYMGQKLLSMIFDTTDDISMLYHVLSEGNQGVGRALRQGEAWKEGMFGALSTLVGGPSLSRKFTIFTPILNIVNAAQAIIHPKESFKRALNTVKDAGILGSLKGIAKFVFDNNMIVWRNSITDSVFQMSEERQIAKNAVERINRVLEESDRSKLWNMLSAQSGINEIFNELLNQTDELDLRDAKLQNLVSTALILQEASNTDSGRVRMNSLKALADITDDLMQGIFDETGALIRNTDSIADNNTKELIKMLWYDLMEYSKYNKDDDTSKTPMTDREKVDNMRKNAKDQLTFIQKINELSKKYDKLFGSSITEDTKASFIMGDLMYEDQLRRYTALSDQLKEFHASLGVQESEDLDRHSRIIALYGNSRKAMPKRIQDALDECDKQIEKLKKLIEKTADGIQKDRLKQLLKDYKSQRFEMLKDQKYFEEYMMRQSASERSIRDGHPVQNTSVENEHAITDTAERIVGESLEDDDELFLTKEQIAALDPLTKVDILRRDAEAKKRYSIRQNQEIDSLIQLGNAYFMNNHNRTEQENPYVNAVTDKERLAYSLDRMASDRMWAVKNVDKINIFGQLLKQKEQLRMLTHGFDKLLDSDNYDGWADQHAAIQNKIAELVQDSTYDISVRIKAANYLGKKANNIGGIKHFRRLLETIRLRAQNCSKTVKSSKFDNYVRALGVLYTVLSLKKYDEDRSDILNDFKQGGSLDIVKEILGNEDKEYLKLLETLGIPSEKPVNAELQDSELSEEDKENQQKVKELVEKDRSNGIESLNEVSQEVSEIINHILNTSQYKEVDEETKETPKTNVSPVTTSAQGTTSRSANQESTSVVITPAQPTPRNRDNEYRILQPKDLLNTPEMQQLYQELNALGWEEFLSTFQASDYPNPANSFRFVKARIGNHDVVLAVCRLKLENTAKGIIVDGVRYGILGIAQATQTNDTAPIQPSIVTGEVNGTQKPVFFTVNKVKKNSGMYQNTRGKHTNILKWLKDTGRSYLSFLESLRFKSTAVTGSRALVDTIKFENNTGSWNMRVETDMSVLEVDFAGERMPVSQLFKQAALWGQNASSLQNTSALELLQEFEKEASRALLNIDNPMLREIFTEIFKQGLQPNIVPLSNTVGTTRTGNMELRDLLSAFLKGLKYDNLRISAGGNVKIERDANGYTLKYEGITVNSFSLGGAIAGLMGNLMETSIERGGEQVKGVSLRVVAEGIKTSTESQITEFRKNPNQSLDTSKAPLMTSIMKMGALQFQGQVVGGFEQIVVGVPPSSPSLSVRVQPAPSQTSQTTLANVVRTHSLIMSERKKKVMSFLESLVSKKLSKNHLHSNDNEHYYTKENDETKYESVTLILHKLAGYEGDEYDPRNPYNQKAISMGNTVDALTRTFFSVINQYDQSKLNDKYDINEKRKLLEHIIKEYTGIDNVQWERNSAVPTYKDNGGVAHEIVIPNLSALGMVNLVDFLIKLNDMCVHNNWTIIPNDVKLIGHIRTSGGNVKSLGGTLDLLYVDEEGRLGIIDIKTLHISSGLIVDNVRKQKVEDHTERWSAQVTTYKMLLEQAILDYVDEYNNSVGEDQRLTDEDLQDIWADNPLGILPIGVVYDADRVMDVAGKKMKQVTRTFDNQAYTILVPIDTTEEQIKAISKDEFTKGTQLHSTVRPLYINAEHELEEQPDKQYYITDGFIVSVGEFNRGEVVLSENKTTVLDALEGSEKATRVPVVPTTPAAESTPDTQEIIDGIKEDEENEPMPSEALRTHLASSKNITPQNNASTLEGNTNIGRNPNMENDDYLVDSESERAGGRIGKKRSFEIVTKKNSRGKGQRISRKKFIVLQVEKVLTELLGLQSQQSILKMAGISLNSLIRNPKQAAKMLASYLPKYYRSQIKTIEDTISNMRYECNRDRQLWRVFTGEISLEEAIQEMDSKGDEISRLTIIKEYSEADNAGKQRIKEKFLKEHPSIEAIEKSYASRILAMQALKQEANDKLKLMESGLGAASIETAMINTAESINDSIDTYGLSSFNTDMFVVEDLDAEGRKKVDDFLKEHRIPISDQEDKGTDVSALLATISLHYSGTQQSILTQLSHILKESGLNVTFINDPSSTRIGRTSIIDTKDGGEVIGISINIAHIKDDEALARALIHEAVHACTHFIINEDSSIKNQIGQMISYILKYLEIENLSKESVYGLSSPAEFVAEFFSNPLFQQMLKGIPAMQNKNIFQRMVSYTMQLFSGMTKSVYDLIAEDMENLLEISNQLAQAGVKTGNKEAFRQKVNYLVGLKGQSYDRFSTLSKKILEAIIKRKMSAKMFNMLPAELQNRMLDCCAG